MQSGVETSQPTETPEPKAIVLMIGLTVNKISVQKEISVKLS
jgi:hypothetical protein